MPERSSDNNGIWTYPTTYPGANYRVNPQAVQLQDGLVEAVGVDGRFLGAIRPFPGMADTTVHGIPTPSATTTITALNNVVYAQYAAVQRGLSSALLKGIVYIADNPGATGKAVYFAYYDTSNDSSDVVMLEDLDSWTDFKLTSVDDWDATSLGKYIYASFVGPTTSTANNFSGQVAPYNKAYFWDFKTNDWDKFVIGFAGRFMGLLPERVLAKELNAGLGDEVCDTGVTAGDGVGKGPLQSDSWYTFGVQLISRKHRLRSYLRFRTIQTLGSLSDHSLRYSLSHLRPPASSGVQINQVRPVATGHDSWIQGWGIPHFDGVRLLRSTDDTFGLSQGKYAGASLYENDNYIERKYYVESTSLQLVDLYYRTVNVGSAGAIGGDPRPTIFSEAAIVQQPQYDPFLDVFGPAPRMKRIVSYDGLLVGVVDSDEPSDFSVAMSENEQTPEAIVWSTLVKQEPENFPPENFYSLENPAERVLQLVRAGDYLFAVTNAGIYRIARSGGTLAVNKLSSSLGGMSRYGAIGVDGALFVVTPSGVKKVDGNTGSIQTVGSMDRIILDDSEWGKTLQHVHASYDARAGCIIFLNTNKKEMYLLWEATGAVTKVEDCPWVFVTEGPDVKTDGPQRAYFVTGAGLVHVIDSAREMGKRSMCGATAAETVNGTVTTASATNLIDSTATFPENCVGFRVFILSGTFKGDIATITARNSSTNLSLTGLSGELAIGDRYSVAPVYTRITLPQLVGQGGLDPFSRKTVTSISVAFSDVAGEASGINGEVTLGVKQNLTTLGVTQAPLSEIPDKCVGRINVHSTRPFPFIEFKGGNLDFEVQSVLVKGILGLSEAQSRQG